jgi:CO/xanthine dehydrogenase FAD-binding subunit
VQPIGYERPRTLAEAVAFLDEMGPDAQLLAGGTDLIIGLHQGRLHPVVVVDIKRIPALQPAIHETNGRLSITADTVMTDIATDDRIRRMFPALAEAAAKVGAVQIRNRATLAGNICNASPAADTAPPLLCYAADVVVLGPAGRRRIPIDEFFAGPGQTTLARGELVLSIELPVPAGPAGSAFGRITRRRGADLATVSVAAAIDGSGRTRLGFGSVGPRPLLATDDSGLLADAATEPEVRASMLATLAMATSPISDVRASREYRMGMLLELGQRVLGAAIARRAEGWR